MEPNLWAAVEPPSGFDRKRVDVDCIDMPTFFREEAVRKETISAPYVQKAVAVSDYFGRKETAKEAVRTPRSAISELEAVPPLVIEMRCFEGEMPLPPELTSVQSSEQPDKECLSSCSTVEKCLQERCNSKKASTNIGMLLQLATDSLPDVTHYESCFRFRDANRPEGLRTQPPGRERRRWRAPKSREKVVVVALTLVATRA